MWFLRKPSSEAMLRVLKTEADRPFTYAAVGATAGTPPAGFVVDHTRVRLGEGEGVFLAATVALRRWQHFQLGWVEAWPADTPLEPGQTVAVLGRFLGTWWLNTCRIVYVVDEAGPIGRFGFAYGTLPEHLESGEERFVIEWDHGDDSVWYDIVAFSRPRHVLARLGKPLMRRLQKKFGRDSAAAMQRSV